MRYVAVDWKRFRELFDSTRSPPVSASYAMGVAISFVVGKRTKSFITTTSREMASRILNSSPKSYSSGGCLLSFDAKERVFYVCRESEHKHPLRQIVPDQEPVIFDDRFVLSVTNSCNKNAFFGFKKEFYIQRLTDATLSEVDKKRLEDMLMLPDQRTKRKVIQTLPVLTDRWNNVVCIPHLHSDFQLNATPMNYSNNHVLLSFQCHLQSTPWSPP